MNRKTLSKEFASQKSGKETSNAGLMARQEKQTKEQNKFQPTSSIHESLSQREFNRYDQPVFLANGIFSIDPTVLLVEESTNNS